MPTPPPIQLGAELFGDDFQNPEQGMLPRSSPEPASWQQGYEGGNYVVRAVDPEWSGDVELTLPGTYRDARLAVDLRSVGDRGGAVYLECRRSEDSGYGAVLFLDQGVVLVARIEGESATPLARPANTPYGRLRRAGMTLALTCVGDRISLSLDGMEIASGRDGTHAEGRMRFGTEGTSRELAGSFELRLRSIFINQVSAPPETLRPLPSPGPIASTGDGAQLSEADVAARVSPSVVRVLAGGGSGSGVRIREGIITSEHVVRGLQQVQIERSDGTRQTATVVRTDPWFDLALLSTPLEIPSLDLEPIGQQRQGDPLLVLGYPGDLPGSATLTRGLLSAVRELQGVTFVQTDAAVTFGSSGGAIVNMRGRLVGITEGTLGPSGVLNLGIASESVRAFLDGAQLVGPDAAEPDDAREQGKPLVIGGAPVLRSFHASGDVDWFSLTLTAGDEVAIFTDSDRCDTLVRLYRPDGETLIDEDDDGGRGYSSWLQLNVPETATYHGSVSHALRGGVCREYYLAARVL